ncbi:hypothetical protein [Desulfosporosinus sp. OT]|uniref:hypothetical protein n=1 Tax=Desulfosporosinus sp. OT TaxID=913865 RepID=UPI0011126BC4|nr:hypothetical protein [Desulfosporosinus sp. OT]
MPKAPSAGPKTLSSHELAFLQDGRVSLKPTKTLFSHGLPFLQTRSSHVLTFLQDGEKEPCALPRVLGRSLSRSLLLCLRKDVAPVSYCVLGLGLGKRTGEGTVHELHPWFESGDGTFHVHRLEFWVGRFNGSLLGCLRKDVCICVTLRPRLSR